MINVKTRASKPDQLSAWANFVAMDENGYWYEFADEPVRKEPEPATTVCNRRQGFWSLNTVGTATGQYRELRGWHGSYVSWRETLSEVF